jgi:hypothetical protein
MFAGTVWSESMLLRIAHELSKLYLYEIIFDRISFLFIFLSHLLSCFPKTFYFQVFLSLNNELLFKRKIRTKKKIS